jgi:hypothetical protein
MSCWCSYCLQWHTLAWFKVLAVGMGDTSESRSRSPWPSRQETALQGRLHDARREALGRAAQILSRDIATFGPCRCSQGQGLEFGYSHRSEVQSAGIPPQLGKPPLLSPRRRVYRESFRTANVSTCLFKTSISRDEPSQGCSACTMTSWSKASETRSRYT